MSKSKQIKKILVVSSWAPPAIGGPQNLYNLFSFFPKDSYCILTSYYGIDNYSAKNGTWLKGKYIFYDNPSFIDSPENRPRISEESKGREAINRLRHLVKRFDFLKIILGPFLIFSQIFMIVRQGIKTIKKERIEIMLGISDFGQALISTYLLHKLTKRPYLLHLYDIYAGNFYPFPGGLLAKIFEKCLFKDAKKIIVTNDGTRNFYEEKYRNEFTDKLEVIYNTVFADKYLELRTPYRPREPYTIVFTGRICWPQIESLKNLVKAVGEIKDLKINLVFYAPQPKEYLESLGIDLSNVTLASASPMQMPEIQSKADILFLPLSWHTKAPQIIATATPGKLTDYLIASRPILIHAPASSFLVKYAKENNFALVVDEENIEKLKMAIRKLLTDKKFSEELIKNAKKTFLKNHDANKNKTPFQSLFLK